MNDSQLGLGVLVNRLHGNAETVEAHKTAISKVISEAAMKDNELHLHFTDGTGIRVWDDGQSCCETRYMTTDDDLPAFVGATFTGLELRDAPNRTDEDSYEEHEVQFLLVNTSKGVFTLETHNEHNGYYGGFAVEVRALEAA